MTKGFHELQSKLLDQLQATQADLDAQQAAAFANIPTWMSCTIRTDKALTIRLNSATNPAITVNEYESPFHLKLDIEITNIYITNTSGSTANIRIFLV